MAISLFLIEDKLLNDIALNKVIEFEQQLHNYFHQNHQDVIDEINKYPVYSDELAQKLQEIILEFKREFLQVI